MSVQDQAVVNYSRTRLLLVIVASIAAAVIAGVLWVVLGVLRPLPPRTVRMTTGSEGSAYHELGKRYRAALAEVGIDLQLLPSAGDVENLARLRDPQSRVSIGLLQSGLTDEHESPGLVSLGTVFYEPLWIFYRGRAPSGMLRELKGRRISIGPEGSGTRALALKLLASDGIRIDSTDLLPLVPADASEQLVHGQIDAAVMLTSWDAPAVQQLLSADGVKLLSLAQADALAALYPYLNKLVLPEGAGDLVTNNPPADVALLASKASLVVRRDLHPAIQYLLLNAAVQIHSKPELFQHAGQFPAAEAIDLPLGEEAREFYKSGRPFLQRYLPFWLAVLLERLLVILIPVVGVAYPLVSILPAVYSWRIRRRIFRLYGEMRYIEDELEAGGDQAGPDNLATRVEQLEERVNRIRVPAPFAPMLYTLRSHITLVRERLERPHPAAGTAQPRKSSQITSAPA